MNKKEIKFETLKKEINVKSIVIGVLVVILIVLVIMSRVSHAAFTSSLNVPLVNGKINYKHPDFKVMGMYVQSSSGSSTYNETNTMPSGSEYIINSSKSYCTKGVQGEKDSGVVLETVNGRHVIEKLTKNDRCYLYFDVKLVNNVASILDKYTKNTSRSGVLTGAFISSTPTTIYSKEDDDGTSYVFAGENPNNWVKLGNMYFRIIRFNGNGSIRLIYSGTERNIIESIGSVKFNTRYNDNMYVGLQYTAGNAHGNGTNSTILGLSTSTKAEELYGWYNNNIKNIYEDLIDSNVGFCSDRTNSTSSTGIPENPGSGGIYTTTTYYAAGYRYFDGNNYRTSYTPTLKCANNNDLLKLPVGLITADEYMLAGGSNNNITVNTTLWLNTGEEYWTMTPFYIDGTYSSSTRAHVMAVYNGWINSLNVDNTATVRPVINLKSTVNFEDSGNGTELSPWIVSV